MRRTAAFLIRHPELVSGSIGQLFLRYRRQTQPNRQIHPMRIFGVNQIYLPSAVPILQLFFARNRRLHRAKNFKMHQPVNGIFRSMSRRHAAAMLRKPLQQVRRDANVQRSIMLACNYVYAGRLFISHALESAAQWTLKQVQGDANWRGFLIRHAELVSASILPPEAASQEEEWTLKQVQGDGKIAKRLIRQTRHAFGLIFGNQRRDQFTKAAALQYLRKLMQRQVDPVVGHAALREIIGADAFRTVA